MTAVKIFCAIIAIAIITVFPSEINGARRFDSNTRTPTSELCSGNLFLPATFNCYKEGSGGPCRETMTIQPMRRNSRLAKCDCDTFGDSSARPNVFWREHNRCYFLFDQGPCGNGQWLNVNRNRQPFCQMIPCPEQFYAQEPKTPRDNFIFSRSNSCYMDNKPADICENDEVLKFDRDLLRPICAKVWGSPADTLWR